MLVQAKLIKHTTDDGLMEMFEDVPLGKIYFVDLDTVRTQTFLHVKSDTRHDKEVVDAQDESGNMLPLPLELLQVVYEN